MNPISPNSKSVLAPTSVNLHVNNNDSPSSNMLSIYKSRDLDSNHPFTLSKVWNEETPKKQDRSGSILMFNNSPPQTVPVKRFIRPSRRFSSFNQQGLNALINSQDEVGLSTSSLHQNRSTSIFMSGQHPRNLEDQLFLEKEKAGDISQIEGLDTERMRMSDRDGLTPRSSKLHEDVSSISTGRSRNSKLIRYSLPPQINYSPSQPLDKDSNPEQEDNRKSSIATTRHRSKFAGASTPINESLHCSKPNELAIFNLEDEVLDKPYIFSPQNLLNKLQDQEREDEITFDRGSFSRRSCQGMNFEDHSIKDILKENTEYPRRLGSLEQKKFIYKTGTKDIDCEEEDL